MTTSTIIGVMYRRPAIHYRHLTRIQQRAAIATTGILQVTFIYFALLQPHSNLVLAFKRSLKKKQLLAFITQHADHIEPCLLLFQLLSQMVKQRLWIVSPHFVPDASIINSLQLTALRGVDVRILLPEKPDKRLVWLSSFANLDEVQRTGIKVYRYQAGFLHQKVWLIDDDCAFVGTANLDNRSFRLNFEVNVVTRDKSFAAQVAAMLEKDFARSRLLPHGELATRGLMFRLAVRCSYLLAPIL